MDGPTFINMVLTPIAGGIVAAVLFALKYFKIVG